ncbi:occludin, partial [Bacteroides salyersiae]
MKKLILSLSLLLATVAVSAQSELPSDSIPRSPSENYKEFGGFLLDMGLMSVMPPQLPKMNFDISDAGKDYNRLFRLHPDVTYSQGLSDVFSPSYSGFGWSGFGSSQNLQMGSFKLKNGMRINTYGEYNA